MVAKMDNEPIMILSDTGTKKIGNTIGCIATTAIRKTIVQEHDRLALQFVQW
jgi:hypothetical protein